MTDEDQIPVVMIVDDEASVREMVSIALRMRGYESILCADGVEALDELERGTRVDVVVADIRMPRMDGIELVSRMRRQADLAAIPVIAMSAYNDELQERAVMAAGADRFLAKPFGIGELRAALDAQLKRHPAR